MDITFYHLSIYRIIDKTSIIFEVNIPCCDEVHVYLHKIHFSQLFLPLQDLSIVLSNCSYYAIK